MVAVEGRGAQTLGDVDVRYVGSVRWSGSGKIASGCSGDEQQE